MPDVSLTSLAEELLVTARDARAGRAARMVYGGQNHTLHQTVIALVGGRSLSEHHNPGQATVQVLRGHIQIECDGQVQDGPAGTYLVVPEAIHALHAEEDSAILLTAVTG